MTELKITLRAAVGAAKDGLGLALRALIYAGVPDGNADRNTLENHFEAAKNALTGDVQSSHLDAAFQQLTAAVKVLAKQEKVSKDDLAAVRAAAALARKHLAELGKHFTPNHVLLSENTPAPDEASEEA
jgi:hypothetical protein